MFFFIILVLFWFHKYSISPGIDYKPTVFNRLGGESHSPCHVFEQIFMPYSQMRTAGHLIQQNKNLINS